MSDLSIKEGLSYLFGTEENSVSTETDKLVYLPVSQITSSDSQPRKTFDKNKLLELSASIKINGILQPILVRKKDGQYEIVAGERRYRAAKLCGLEKIPCLIENIKDKVASIYALIENLQRTDLNVMEEAEAFHRLITDYGLSHDQAAQYIGKSRPYLTNTLRLLNLHDTVRNLISEEKIQMGQGRALLALPEEKQIEAANTIINLGLNARQTEMLVKKMLASEDAVEKSSLKPVFLSGYSHKLSDYLESKFKVSQVGEKYKVQGTFDSESEFKKFLSVFELE